MGIKTWCEFQRESEELAAYGLRLLFPDGIPVGKAFIATIRKDGGPRLHPVSVVHFQGHLYIMCPHSSPKCRDLQRDGRYALQAFPPTPNPEGEELFVSGLAYQLADQEVEFRLREQSGFRVGVDEVIFELRFERVMVTRLEGLGTPQERAAHQVWRAEGEAAGNDWDNKIASQSTLAMTGGKDWFAAVEAAGNDRNNKIASQSTLAMTVGRREVSG